MTEIDEITTTDLSKFRHRETELMRDLIDAWIDQGLPDDFDDDGVQVMMNFNSGNVFLTNSEYQAATMNGDRLETFYNCPECGHEGFKDEFEKDADCEECQRIAGAEEEDDDEQEELDATERPVAQTRAEQEVDDAANLQEEVFKMQAKEE